MAQDPDMLEEAVRSNGNSLKYIKKELITQELALLAIQQSPMAIKFLSVELKKDKEIALEAIERKVQSIEFIHPDLYNDVEVIEKVAEQDGEFALYYATKDLKSDKDLVLKCVR